MLLMKVSLVNAHTQNTTYSTSSKILNCHDEDLLTIMITIVSMDWLNINPISADFDQTAVWLNM